MTENQNPEQKARDNIDALLGQAGWVVQSAKKIDLNTGLGQAVREYPTDTGPADYVLFVDKKAVGVIEAKREEEGQRLTAHEGQTEGYATAKLKWVNNQDRYPTSTKVPASSPASPMAATPSRVRAKCSTSTVQKQSGNG
jgi:type I restriction enzyme R subunit